MNKDSIKKNWQEIPLEDFNWMLIEHADGTTTDVYLPHGDGVLQRFMADLWVLIDKTYETLSSDEELDRFATAYEVPVIRNGEWGYEPQHKLTFQDLPAISDSFAKMQKRKQAQKMDPAKERRIRKQLGEWKV